MASYADMSEPELLAALGDDGRKWAEAFCQIASTRGHDIDIEWMTTWFCNAIEGSHAIRCR